MREAQLRSGTARVLKRGVYQGLHRDTRATELFIGHDEARAARTARTFARSLGVSVPSA
jgi:hypothetical protein